jgi:hypothetical protein
MRLYARWDIFHNDAMAKDVRMEIGFSGLNAGLFIIAAGRQRDASTRIIPADTVYPPRGIAG